LRSLRTQRDRAGDEAARPHDRVVSQRRQSLRQHGGSRETICRRPWRRGSRFRSLLLRRAEYPSRAGRSLAFDFLVRGVAWKRRFLPDRGRGPPGDAATRSNGRANFGRGGAARDRSAGWPRLVQSRNRPRLGRRRMAARRALPGSIIWPCRRPVGMRDVRALLAATSFSPIRRPLFSRPIIPASQRRGARDDAFHVQHGDREQLSRANRRNISMLKFPPPTSP